MSTRDVRMQQTAFSIRHNIRLTIRGAGGDPDTIDGYELAGWDSPEEAIAAHKEDAFQVWLEYAPRSIRETRLLRARFEREWPTIREWSL